MALELPPNFENDIQGKDTALVPIISIKGLPTSVAGGYQISDTFDLLISTNVLTTQVPVSLNVANGIWNYESKTTKPLLLNIPSLKESIDIEKRNYKISSINIDISNFPHEGQRFSELIVDRSLINVECRIYWASPSANHLHPYDQIEWETLTSDDDAFQVYYGTIRRYTHDDEKVRLVVEDRSQSTLHKDLPLEELGTGDEVPEKYKGKPIPLVYGSVDKSPCVIKNQLSTSGADSEIIIVGDNPDAISSIDEFKIFGNDVYVNILEDIGAYLSAEYEYDSRFTEQYIIENKQIKVKLLYGETTDNSTEATTNALSNTIAENLAGVYLNSKVNNIKLFTASDQVTDFFTFLGQAAQNGGATLDYGAVNIGDTVTISFSGGTYNLYKISYSFVEPPQHFDSRFYRIINATNIVLQKDNEGSGENIVLFFGNASGGQHPMYGVGIGDANDGVADSTDQIFIQSTKNNIAVLNTDSSEDDTNQTWDQQWRDSWGGINVLLACIVSGNEGVQASLNIGSMEIQTYYLIDKFIESDFYANVKGRAMVGDNSPTAPSAIAHILENELGQTVEETSDTYGWQYAFTVDKKINSKKLIENIASVSPYIPRFDNMGNFKFDVIPENGQPQVGEVVQTIKEADCIDFSFSRSKIEQVYSKIVFKYNWDYARGEFNDSVESDTDLVEGYDPTYYGFKMPPDGEYDHAESELTIGGEQGKYIRNHNTAQEFADWFLLWSCNQHLKMKVKLPLKYMNLEIGDLVDFDAILGGVKPYGIDYTALGSTVNGQNVFKNFLITSTNKTLEWVEIECIQMHNLVICLEGYDCAGVCNGGAEIDECGVCGGSGETFECGCDDIPTGDCDCNGNVTDDCGVCGGGNADMDECGVCNGDGIADGACDCAGNVVDCAGECDGDAVIDACGECNGNNSSCDECIELEDQFGIPFNCGSPAAPNDPSGCYHYDICFGGEELYTGTGGEGACEQVPNMAGCAETYANWSPPQLLMQTELKPFPNRGYETNAIDDMSLLIESLDPTDLDEIEGVDGSGNAITYYGIKSENLILNIVESLALNGDPSEAFNNVKYKITLTEVDHDLGMGQQSICGIPFVEGCPATQDFPLIEFGENGQTISSGWIHFGDGEGDLNSGDWASDNQLDVWGGVPKYLFTLGKGNLDAHLENYSYYAFNFTLSLEMDVWIETSQTSFNYDHIKEYSYRIFIGDCGLIGDMNNDGGWNVLDIVELANCILADNCGCAGDLNGDGRINVIDIVALANCVLVDSCGGYND